MFFHRLPVILTNKMIGCLLFGHRWEVRQFPVPYDKRLFVHGRLSAWVSGYCAEKQQGTTGSWQTKNIRALCWRWLLQTWRGEFQWNIQGPIHKKCSLHCCVTQNPWCSNTLGKEHCPRLNISSVQSYKPTDITMIKVGRNRRCFPSVCAKSELSNRSCGYN
jgi:hypothetical protein